MSLQKNPKKIYISDLGITDISTGRRRLYLESSRLKQTRFQPGSRITVEVANQFLKISISDNGDAMVSACKRGKREGRPVIDIRRKELAEAFAGIEKVKVMIGENSITVVPLESEIARLQAMPKGSKRLTFIDIFAGGGTLTEAFKMAGFQSVGAVEKNDRYLETYEANNPGAMTYCGSVADVDWRDLPSANIVLASPPCEDFSQAQTQSPSSATEHLTFYLLQGLGVLRPAAIVIEQVPAYAKSPYAALLRRVLTDYGYHLTESIVDGVKMGSLSRRKRFCMIASQTPGFAFDEAEKPRTKRVKDILEQTPRTWLTEENSQTIRSFISSAKHHAEKGNGFRMAAVTEDATMVATITKGHAKRRKTDPLLTDGEGRYSFFSTRELARIDGLPDSYILPESHQVACEIVGQGVLADAFSLVAKQLKKHLITT